MNRPSSTDEAAMEVPRWALTWAPDGKRRRERPKTTWTSTAVKELEDTGIHHGEQQQLQLMIGGDGGILLPISHREKIVYLSDPNDSNVCTVRGCTTSATKSSCQEASDSFDSYSRLMTYFGGGGAPDNLAQAQQSPTDSIIEDSTPANIPNTAATLTVGVPH